MKIRPLVPLAAAAMLAAAPVQSAPPTAEEVSSASYDGGALPEGQTGLTVQLQILLDRAGISPGIIDGWKGGMTESALLAFETREGLPQDGVLDPDVWSALGGDGAGGFLQSYTITEKDTQNLSEPLPDDYAKMAELERLGYLRVSERLAEEFHMDEDFLKALNPGASFAAGETITVAAPGPRLEAEVARIEVRKDVRRLAAFDDEGNMVANYPVVVGSSQTPSPSGGYEVVGVAVEPTYTYNPDENFQQGDNTEKLVLPPGPNGPVGLVWIDLSKPTYGIHGTDEPAELFQEYSHGCVRMTNWDALELAHMVSAGVTVEFVE